MFTCSAVDDDQANAFVCSCHSPAFARVNAIIEHKFSRRSFLAGAATAAAATAFRPAQSFAAVPAAPATPTGFANVKLFDGTSAKLIEGRRIVVEGNRIKAVEDASQPAAAGIRIIDGGGRTLMPGLIDAHWHTMMVAVPAQDLLVADIGYINLAAADQAEKTLMRGFTSIRDAGGPSFGLKRAIDSGLSAGPRIWPSGALISQTSGHADFRLPYEVPAQSDAPFSRTESIGVGMIADGADQVLKRVREQLMLGASQIKLTAGGGVTSHYDPIDVSQYTEAEFRAAVDAAENWGTYVLVHAYTSRAIQTAVRGGVRCVEHGQLMNEETAKILSDKGIWFSSQPFLADDDATAFPKGSPNYFKQLQVAAGTDNAYQLARKYKLKTAWGTDILFDPRQAARQGHHLTKMKRWYTPIEILTMATSTNAELLAMSGPRNPYPGKIGVIEAGAYADLLLLDGDPTANIDLIGDPEKNLKVIMKDGRIYKNTLAA